MQVAGKLAERPLYKEPEKQLGPGRFECIAKIGQGSYGNVFKCRNRATGQIVAVKKFIESEDNPSIRKIAYREIRILKQLRHPNIVRLLEVFRRKRRLHLVFEFCHHTLLEEIQRSSTGMAESEARRIVSQVLQGAAMMHHKANCIHRDIKPENILMTADQTVKLCDFGFARSIRNPHGDVDDYTDYVATRWYRAPELLLDRQPYGCGVDIWAIGCVFAECVSSRPLFPGSTDLDQLYLIRKTLQEKTNSAPTQNPDTEEIVPVPRKFPFLSEEACELLLLMLEINPEVRASAHALLQHSYFAHSLPSSAPLEMKPIRAIPKTANPTKVRLLADKGHDNEKVHGFARMDTSHMPPIRITKPDAENVSSDPDQPRKLRPLVREPPSGWRVLRDGIDYRKTLSRPHFLPNI